MDIADLLIFTEAARAGSFTRAAKNLRMAQPNVSTAIAALEKEWQIPLFIRSKTGVRLTKKGEDFFHLAEKIMGLAREAESMMTNDHEPSGTLMIGSMESVAITRLPEYLYEYGKKWPKVRLSLQTADSGPLLDLLRKGELDCAFVGTPTLDDVWEEKILFREEMVIAFSKNHRFTLTSIRDNRFLVLPAGCTYRERLEALAKSYRIQNGGFHELGSINSILACTIAGMGASIFTRSFLRRYPEARERLRMIRLPKEFRYMEIRLVWRKRRYLPSAMQEFIGLF